MQQREDLNNDDKTKFKKIPSLYWKRGKRPRNMSGWRWYKVSTGFWRPEGENNTIMKFEKRGKWCQNINTWDVQSHPCIICEFTGFFFITKWKLSVVFTELLCTFSKSFKGLHSFITLTITQDWPRSAFCMRTWVRVQRIPPKKDARSTMMKPSRLNWVDSNVNIKRPTEISRTTRIRNGFCT